MILIRLDFIVRVFLKIIWKLIKKKDKDLQSKENKMLVK